MTVSNFMPNAFFYQDLHRGGGEGGGLGRATMLGHDQTKIVWGR